MLHDTAIECVEHYKYLDIMLDQRLRFCAHADYINKSGPKYVHYVGYIRKYINTDKSICTKV